MDSPLQRKTNKWGNVSATSSTRATGETIYSRPAPPQSMTKSISMEDLTQTEEARPPTASLYDEAVTPEKKYSNASSRIIEQPRIPGGTNSMFNSPGEPVAHDGWVTVFGFPGGSMNVVLAHFKTFGPMTRYEEGRGNWVDVCYASKWSAQKALSKNGTVLPGTSIMVGVVPRAAANEDADVSYLTSPKKKNTLSSNVLTSSTNNSRTKAIFNVERKENAAPADAPFPIRLFKFIMGW